MAVIIPPDTRAVGTADPPGDMNNVADVLGLHAQALAQIAGGGSAPPAGNAANLTKITAAAAAAAYQPSAGLQVLTGGGTISAATVTAAIAAGYQGIFLDPRFVWTAGGLVLANVANFTIESRMSGSVGYSATINYNTTGYLATGSGTDGIQVYGTSGGGAQGITFRGVSIVGSNSNAVLHIGGRHRRLRVEDSFIYNTNSTATTVALASNGVDVTTFAGAGTLNVASATSFAGAGNLLVATSVGMAFIRYTATTSTSFTGCTTFAGTGTLATSGTVQQAAFGLIDDTQLNNGNGEDNCLSHVDICSTVAAIGIGINDQVQHVNDSLWSDISTSGGQYAIVATNGGNHTFVNFYDRSQPTIATVYNHGAHLIFVGGENGNDGSHSGGITYLQDGSNANTVLVNATVTAGASSPSDILHLSSGNFSCLGKMRSNNACAFVVSGGTLYLADPEAGLGNVTVSGSGGALNLANVYMGSGNAPTVTWTGTPVYPLGVGVAASGHANAQTTAQSVTWTPPAAGARFRVSVWIQVTTVGTSTVPVLSFTQYQGTAFSQTLPMWQMNSAAAAPTYTCAAAATFVGSFMGETDGSGTAVTLTITPTGSTYRYSVVIERVA